MAFFVWDNCWINVNVATFANSCDFGIISNAAVAVKDERIVWCGKEEDLSSSPYVLAKEVFNGNGQWLTPGLIDCHTHLIYAGSRAAEFEQRLAGFTYREISERGGGILETVRKTRETSEEDLFNTSLHRIRKLMAEGVTSLEVKSGYGLNPDSEYKLLQVAKRLQATLPITIKSTFLGAHALPPEYARPDEYIDLICKEMIPWIAHQKLATTVDAFCEPFAFSTEHVEVIFATAIKYGLKVKLHADQLSDSGGAMLAAKYRALSADHLEYASEQGIAAMAKADTVAVLLPGPFYFLKEKQLPPVHLFRKHGIPIAIGTDCNPGTSPLTSIRWALNMACLLFGLTTLEALLGVTRHAAQALGIENLYGSIAPGKMADFAIWNIEHLSELVYSLETCPLSHVVKHGKLLNIQTLSEHLCLNP